MDQYILSISIPVIAGLLGWFGNKALAATQRHEESHAILKEANLFQIKAILIYMYRKTRDSGGEVTTQELDVFNDLYGVYQKLGGNSFIDTIFEHMNQMKVVD